MTTTNKEKVVGKMSLKISSLKKYRSKIIWGIVIIIFAACLLRVFIWEHNYYASKEGSARAVSPTSIEAPTEDVDKTPITDDEVVAWTVAANHPRYLSIEKLGITNARVLSVGVGSAGQLLTPTSIYDVGWYDKSGLPGRSGAMLMDGHSGIGAPGVFNRLPELTKGDIITVERGDGAIFKYEVVENNTISLDDADSKMAEMQRTAVSGKEGLNLITCTGDWSYTRQTYLSRQFLRAVRVE
ncbi:class F sortase [Candidatus Saccharibacteria bacterium]|nr:class F sortase [Candidatus Saccharibacteria bacterium]